MPDQSIVALIVRLVTGSVAAFFAIMLWARTRDTAWMLVIIAIILEYAKILFTAFQTFGFISRSFLIIGDLELGRIILDNFPTAFLAAALIVVLYRNRYK
ncbi:MAG: hypothetical protein JW874_08845 [Spirochaetales bacterium]|nr:hypothetical protein [Spirochaetales bacterium]